ncbi:MAG: hypothetical protein H5U07_11650, partial [Candidatus Aminicenantes bacterium]|nr:hypothetical protein [Candidatus Aminicenantes bacterium]
EVFKIKNAGLKEIGGHRVGDLYVRIKVKTPDHLDKEQKALLTRLAELRGEALEDLDKSVFNNYLKFKGNRDFDQ